MNIEDRKRLSIADDNHKALVSFFLLLDMFNASRARDGFKIHDFHYLMLFYLKTEYRHSAFNAYDPQYYSEDICTRRIYDFVLRSLLKQGYISRVQRGWYKLTASGLDYCQAFWQQYTMRFKYALKSESFILE
jgi:hypothetical protein